MSKRFILIEFEELPHAASDTEGIADGIQHLLEATLGCNMTIEAMSEDELEERFLKMRWTKMRMRQSYDLK